MIGKKNLLAVLLLFVILAGIVIYANIIPADSGVSYCCEKTTYGAWCQNDEQNNCDSNYRSSPTSCESTSYCKTGTCINTDEGTCTNSPEKNCEEEGGVWSSNSSDEIPQCQLGCCLIGDQAAYVTQTNCKKLSSVYGLETNFNTGITSEAECIASATPNVKGACVIANTEDFSNDCEFITKSECDDKGGEYYEGRLCSDEELATNCGPSKETTCVEGEDRVYFLDSCGNLANIYDASKINDKNYWAKVYSPAESCGYGESNANSASCGNCDYFLGSTCKSKERTDNVDYGNNICKDLSCEYQGKTYQHGETWCADSSGRSESLPGSRDFRLVCYNGDVSIEPCADYRQESCIESEINGFKTAACTVNKWQGCTSQTEKKDCENKDRRDCKWQNEKCVPSNSPGFDFWSVDESSKGGSNDAQEICSIASTTCHVTCKKGVLGGKKCESDLGCVDSNGNLKESWKEKMNNICTSLGDCGSSDNYIGVQGFNKINDMFSES